MGNRVDHGRKHWYRGQTRERGINIPSLQGWRVGLIDAYKWQPTPVFLPGESHGCRSLVGYSPWGHRVRRDWATSLTVRARWLSGKESACQYRRHRFDPRVEMIPWRRKWQPAPVFLPGKSSGQRSLAGYSHKESATTKHTQIGRRASFSSQRVQTPLQIQPFDRTGTKERENWLICSSVFVSFPRPSVERVSERESSSIQEEEREQMEAGRLHMLEERPSGQQSVHVSG